MFRLRSFGVHSRRLFHSGAVTRDQVLDQLQVCSTEDQVFDVVGRNKAKLSASHVGCAVGLLWQFQRERPQMLRTVELVRNHPQFLTLRVLAENKIGLMDDVSVVDMLYDVLRYAVRNFSFRTKEEILKNVDKLIRRPLYEDFSKYRLLCSTEEKSHVQVYNQKDITFIFG